MAEGGSSWQSLSGCLQTFCLSQFGLSLVKGPELVGLQLQGGGNVQRIEGAHAEGSEVAFREIGANRVDAIGWMGSRPDAGLAILLKSA